MGTAQLSEERIRKMCNGTSEDRNHFPLDESEASGILYLEGGRAQGWAQGRYLQLNNP